MEKMKHGNRMVKVLCVETNGVWAMVRLAGYSHSMPYVVRVKELSQPTSRAADEATCSAKYHLALAEKGDTRCGVCGQPLRR